MGLSYRSTLGWMLTSYIGIRALSFLFRENSAAEEFIAALLFAAFLYICSKQVAWSWRLLVLELLLDGAGHFFELRGLLLRTWVLGVFALIWLWHKLRARTPLAVPPKNTLIALSVFGLFLAWSVINGFVQDHSARYIAQDAMLYLFILLLVPALEFERAWEPLYERATKVFIWGTAFFSVATFALYSLGIAALRDPYYHWFRNVASGKITDLGMHFFRIVLSEHILFVPIILIIFSLLLKKSSDKKLWALLACALVVIILNFTRIYFVALALGALLLTYRTPWKAYLKVAGLTLAMSAVIFFGFHLAASRGQSAGLELLGVRAAGFKAPEADVSGAIRMAMLPDIHRTITARPLLGSGLGTTVSYIDPITKNPETRTQFDWGYFEMIAELGILGTLAYLTFLITIIYNLARAASPLTRGLVAGAVALFVVNITTPALFQGFGVLYFAFLTVAAQHPALLNKNTAA